MRHLTIYVAGIVGFTILMACGVGAQTLNIWPGIAPGSENWKQLERVEKGPPGNAVYNVVTPTITVYVPEKSRATGTGVIIAPGGAFRFVAIDSEGHSVARWLQEKGIAAFVLKYRVNETPAEGLSMGALGASREAAEPGETGRSTKYAVADGIQALKVVRQHAAEWGISPNRVGFMGFSAGARITTETLFQEDAAARPSFAAPIYGPSYRVIPTIPAGPVAPNEPVSAKFRRDSHFLSHPANFICEPLR